MFPVASYAKEGPRCNTRHNIVILKSDGDQITDATIILRFCNQLHFTAVFGIQNGICFHLF
jgi:hypothetical protein